MRQFVVLFQVGLFFLASLASELVHAAAPPLIFGVFPNLSVKLPIETYRPVADALQKQLGRPVELYSAPDFKTFVARTRLGEFDLVLTAPHLAWLARQDAGYRPLLKYANPVHGVLIVKADSPIQTLAQLRGKHIATADPLAVVVMAMQSQIHALGLTPGKDLEMTNAQSHNNAAMQAFNGVADAAVLGAQPYRRLPAEVQAGLRILAETPPLSSQVYLTHPRIRDVQAQAIRQALLAYAAAPAGQAFMERGGFGGLVDLDGRELRAFKPYAQEAEWVLKTVR